MSSSPSKKEDLLKTHHPSLTTHGGSRPPAPSQSVVAVKLFQFDGNRTTNNSHRPFEVTRVENVSHGGDDHSDSQQDAVQISQHQHQQQLPSRPSSAIAASKKYLAHAKSTAVAASTSSVVVLETGNKKLMFPQNQNQNTNNHDRPPTATSATTNKSILIPEGENNKTQSNNSAANRATSTSLMYERYDTKGHYGPDCTSKNILHTRHKIQFEHGKVRRANSTELGSLIATMKKGIKNSHRTFEQEDREKMGSDYFDYTNKYNPKNFRKSSSDKKKKQQQQKQNEDDLIATNNKDNYYHDHDQDDDDEDKIMIRRDTMPMHSNNNNNNNNRNRDHEEDEGAVATDDDDDDDKIEAAFKSGQLAKNLSNTNNTNDKNNNHNRPSTAKNSNNNNHNIARPFTAAINNKTAVSTTIPRPQTSILKEKISSTSALPNNNNHNNNNNNNNQNGRRYSPSPSATQQQQHEEELNDFDPALMTAQQFSLIRRGGSPTLLGLIKNTTFRGKTVQIEKAYLDGLQQVLAPKNSASSTSVSTSRNNNHHNNNNNNSRPSSSVGVYTTKVRSPLTASILKSFHQNNQDRNNGHSTTSASPFHQKSSYYDEEVNDDDDDDDLESLSSSDSQKQTEDEKEEKDRRHNSTEGNNSNDQEGDVDDNNQSSPPNNIKKSTTTAKANRHHHHHHHHRRRRAEMSKDELSALKILSGRSSNTKASRPASANHILTGTRWHKDVDHGSVPKATALDPQELPRDPRDVKIDTLPDELKFYAVRSNQRRPQSAFLLGSTNSGKNNNGMMTLMNGTTTSATATATTNVRASSASPTAMKNRNNLTNSNNIHSNSASAMMFNDGHPPPSYFFEQSSLLNPREGETGFTIVGASVNDHHRQNAYSSLASTSTGNINNTNILMAKSNPIFAQLAAPSRYKNPKLISTGINFLLQNQQQNHGGEDENYHNNARNVSSVTSPAAKRNLQNPANNNNNNNASSPISPAQEKLQSLLRKDREIRDSLRELAKPTTGIAEYLQNRKQECYCQYTSVIKRKLLELDHQRRTMGGV